MNHRSNNRSNVHFISILLLNFFYHLQAIQKQDAKSLPNINASSLSSPSPLSINSKMKNIDSENSEKNKWRSHREPSDNITNIQRTSISSSLNSAFKPHKSVPNLKYTLAHQNKSHPLMQPKQIENHDSGLKTPHLQNLNNVRQNTPNGKFSHQNRRRPVYQRSNTEPESLEENFLSSINPNLDSLHIPTNTSYPSKQICKSPDTPFPTKSITGSSNNPIPTGCVYLRPEQNIPDVFFASRNATTFKPIVELPKSEHGNIDDRKDTKPVDQERSAIVRHQKLIGGENKSISTNEIMPKNDQDISISRDDIVVTMRSVNV